MTSKEIQGEGQVTRLRSSASTWDVGAISGALNREPSLTRDRVLGSGISFRLGKDAPLSVSLFPPSAERSTGVVRLEADDMLLELIGQDAPVARAEGLVFETKRDFLSLGANGDLMWQRNGLAEATERYQDAGRPLQGTQIPDTDDQHVSGQFSASPLLPNEEGKNYISKMTGRLGKNPRFRESKAGLVCEFDLAVKQLDDPTKTDWHKIVLFRDRAAALRDANLQKGDVVDVMGSYKHVNEYTTKDGRKVRREQLYATVVKRR